MSSGIDLRDSRSLALLASLKQTCAKFAKLEDQLSRELTTRRYAAIRKFREATESGGARLDGQISELQSHYKNEKNRIESIHEGRRQWIQRAYEDGIRNLPSRAQGAKERWMGRLQMKHFLAARKMNADAAEADKAFAAYTEELANQRKLLAGLELRARSYFRGYLTYLRMLQRKPAALSVAAGESANPDELLAEFKSRVETAAGQLAVFRRFLIPLVFSYLPLPVLIVLLIGGAMLGGHLAYGPGLHLTAGLVAVVLVGGVCGIHLLGFGQSNLVETIVESLAAGRRLHDTCRAVAAEKIEQEHQRLAAEFETTSGKINEKWEQSGEVMIDFEKVAREKIEAQVPRLLAKNDSRLQPKLDRLEATLSTKLERLRNDSSAIKVKATEAHDSETAALAADEKKRWDEIEDNWKREIVPIYRDIDAMNGALAGFSAWSMQAVEEWTPPVEFINATKFARLELDLAMRTGSIPKNPRLALPGPAMASIPFALSFPDRGSLLFETADSHGNPTVIGALNNIILRLLSTTPPGKLSFTIIDPIGLGQNFAGLMHLADFEESLISRRIWTQRDQIEERLVELSEHIEKVIQMYLRTEYRTITEYNEQAGSVAEKYHFLVVADFPADFSETAAKRLQSIIASGPRCGVYTLMHWNRQAPLPDGFSADDLKKNSICIRGERNEFTLGKEQIESGAALVLDQPPDAEVAFELVQKIGKASVDSNRVEVPFLQVAPKPSEFWNGDTTQELRIAIGRTGATKLQYLAIGKGTRQHALFAGKTGSGKSTLFHVIITNLALACSPEQVEFYLIDFKKGVEFKCYASKHLPHAKVVAIESDREFGLSVLQRVDEELKQRGDMFRKLGVQDIAGYKRAGGTEPVPRTLLIIDEFQEFFVEDDPIAQTASLLFDRIIRQGRAFGIHVLLGSQTLGGAYSLARATLGQMVIRVALQCNEADAYLIMDDNNSAPRLLSRPGEGIYNDSAGAMEGNSPFQVVWLPDDERDVWLDKVRELAAQHHDSHPGPIVFEGNAPADIRENPALQALFDNRPSEAPPVARCWLGAPNSIKGPTEAVFQPQSGNNLLIVGQRDEAEMTLIGVSLLALAAQYPAGSARFILFNTAIPNSPDAEFMDRILKAVPHDVTVAGPQDVAKVMNEIAAELKARSGDEQGGASPPVFVFIHGLQKFKKLRQEDDFDFSMSGTDAGPKPGAQFNELICEGGGHGMHVIASIDTLNNVNRFMSRKALSEFEMRVAFQMGANDSASLIDSPKAGGLGLHRALLYNEHEGSLETFRPYAPPDAEWLSQAAEKLARFRTR